MISIKKRNNKPIIIMKDGTVLGSVSNLVIEAQAKEEHDLLIVTFTDLNGIVQVFSNSSSNIALDMRFGGGYELRTVGEEDELLKKIVYSYCGMVFVRVMKFKYEIDTKSTIGGITIEIALT